MSWVDNFDDASIDGTKFGTSISGSATIVESGGYLAINTTHVVTDAGMVFIQSKIDKAQSRFYSHKVKATDFETNAAAFFLAIYNSAAGTPVVSDNATVASNLRLYCYQHSTGSIYIIYFNAAGTPYWWNGSTKAWEAVAAVAHVGTINTFYVVQFVHTSIGCRVVLLEGSGCKELQHTTEIAWANLKSPTSDLYVVWGELYTNYYYADCVSGQFKYGDDPEIVAFYNGYDGTATGYGCGRCISYNGGLDFVRSPNTKIITKEMFQAGENVSDVKDIYTLLDGSTLYALCAHLSSVTSKWSISCFTSSDNGVTMVRSGMSAKLTPGGSGTSDENACRFPIMLKDSATGVYRIYYGGDTVSGDFSINYATTLNLTDATYTKYGSNPILSKGTGGTFEDGGVLGADIFIDGATLRMYYGGLRLSTAKWEIGEATSPDWVTWTKLPGNPIVSRLSTLSTVLTVALNSINATVGDSSLFGVKQLVYLHNNQAGQWQINRVESINSSTTLTLSYPANYAYNSGFEALLKSIYWGSLFPAEVRNDGGVWNMFITSFQIGPQFTEVTTFASGTAHNIWTLDKTDILRFPLGSGWDKYSAENMRYIAIPGQLRIGGFSVLQRLRHIRRGI